MADADTTLGRSACPTDAQLRSFSEGDLDTGRTEAIAAHLERCPICQKQLEQLDPSSAGSVDRQAEPSSLVYAEESACGRAVEAAVQRRDRGGKTAADELPQRLGEFELLEPLGAGGMGTVYKARHERLGTTSAVKLLHVSQQADARMIERFQREMVALGKLDHPNIVRALDAGEDAGVHYLVMEYIEGADLAAIVQRSGPLAIADACEAARQAALGLAYVHEQGRVHRDVKPSNLMVASDGQVKLLDLGLARVDEYALDEPTGTTDDLLGAAPDLTRTHQVMGTLEYMPPEQAASSKTVTEKADLYSLGCTLYKLLAGHAPFGSGQSVTAMSQLMAHVQRPAPPIRESRSDVPPGLAQLLERMLAKRPEDRPESAAKIAAELAPYTRGAHLAALTAPAAAAGGASTARALPNTKRMSPHRSVATHRRGLSPGQKGTLAVGMLLLSLLLLAIPVGLIGWLYLQTQTGTVIVEAESPEAEQLLEANGGLFFVPERSSPGTRIPVRPGVQELRPGKYVVEQAPPQERRAVFVPAEFDLARDQQVVVSLRVVEGPPVPSAPSTPSGEREPPSAAGPPVDLIALVDPERDIRGDDWKLVDGVLVSRRDRPSAMHIPYRPPENYRLEATIERVASNESLLLGLVAGGKLAYVAVDSHPHLGAVTGMHTVDGAALGDRSSDIHRGQVLPPGQKVQLTAWVKHLGGQANIRLEADGREIFNWRGAVDRLGTWSGYQPNEPTALYLANWTAELRVSDLQLVPLEGEGAVITFTDPAANPQRAAIERAIWKGAQPRVRTEDGSLTQVTRFAEIRDGMQLVEVSFAGNDWVNDSDLLYFASLETLESLDFSETVITRDGLNLLGPLPNLKRLVLSQLMGEDALAWAAELYPSLTTLNASGNRLDGDNLASLAELPDLQELDLSRTAVTSASLATLPELPSLRTLNLAGTQVDDLSPIERERLPALARLNVLGTSVTENSVEPSAPQAAPPPMRSSMESVDLMGIIDIERDSNAWETTWTREGDALITHPRSRMMLPVHLPQEFDLEMTARAVEPNNSTIIGFALPDGTHFAVGFDHSPHNGPTAILHWVDGIHQENSAVKADVSTFPLDASKPVTVRIAVRGQQEEIDIRAFKNGEEILGWQGDRSRLKVTDDWWLGVDPSRPWISQYDGALQIQKLAITPVDGEVKLPYPPEPTNRSAVVEPEPADHLTETVAPPVDPIAQNLRQRIPGLEVVSGYGPVEVLPLINVPRDYDGWGYGPWVRRNDIFQVQRSRLALPIVLPMEFDIEMTATRRAAGNSPVFVLPLPDGARFAVGFDHSPDKGSFTILHGVDGTEELASPVKTQMVTYPQNGGGPPATVRIRVRGNGEAIRIRAFKNGQEVLRWEGDRSRLRLADRWWAGADRERPWVALYDGLFTIHELKVTPYKGRIGLPDFGPSWGTPDRSVAEWVLAHGGEVHLKLDLNDADRNVRPGEELPERPYWLTRIRNLGGVAIPADWFQQVSRLQQLEELRIDQTSFENADLAPLAELKSLKSFGAYSSPLDDSGIASIVALPRLEKIAIGNTAVTADGLRGLAGHPALKEYGHSGARTADQIAAILREVPHIEHVVFSESDLGGAGLEQLWGLDGMRRLYVNNCRGLVDTDARQLLGLPNLRILDIRGSTFTGDALEPIGRLTSLEKLRMWNQPIGDAGIKHLANLRNLDELDAWKIGLTDEAMPTIAEFSSLQLLKLGDNPGITDASVPLLARLNSLNEMHVTGTSISDQGIHQLQRALPNCRIYAAGAAGVEELDLRGQAITDASLREILGGAVPRKLLLQGPEITDASIAYLASLRGLGELKLYGTSVTNDGLSPLTEAPDLYRIDLWEMPQIDEGALPHISRIPGLKMIVIKSTGVYGPGLELLHGTGINSIYIGHTLLDGEMLEQYIVPFGTLSGLDLAGSRISDEDVELIATKMTVSGYLHLGFNPNITGPGLRFIRDMPELRTLKLDGSAVDNGGLAHLKGAAHLQNLTLRHTAITDASIDTLVTLTALQTLDLQNTQFTSAGVQRLRELMPSVDIVADGIVQ